MRQVNSGGSGIVPGYSAAGFRYGRFGAYGASYVSPGAALNADLAVQQQQRTRIRAQERVGMAASVMDIMGQVTQVNSQMRRHMTEKYQIEF